MNPYETDRLLDVYLLFHFGSREDILAELSHWDVTESMFRFPIASVADTFDWSGEPVKRALDLGCAIGRSSFELSKHAKEVIGIDFSESFVGAAEKLRNGEKVPYLRYSESHLGDELEAECPADVHPDRIRFETGDAMNLRNDLGQFEIVHAANLLCRLSEPLRLLRRLPDLVAPGGQLMLATPCTWLEEFTPKENQPRRRTLEFLREHLDGPFEFVRSGELPFLIREHQRKFQVSSSQFSVWRRQD